MNTDKIYAESVAKEYAPKDNSKIVALQQLLWNGWKTIVKSL